MKTNNALLLMAIVGIFGLFFSGCIIEEENFAPTASFTISPTSGTLQTVFVFDASASTDVEDATADLFIRWDFNGDGSWDTDWIMDKRYNIQYLDISTYITKLEVKDTQGATAQASQSVDVSEGGSTGTVIDPRDGYSYITETIGSQTWFSENLKYQSRGSWCYDDDPGNCSKYGRLYDWESAMDACPDGWHLPSDDEWKQIELALGMTQSEADKAGYRGTDEGRKMKSTSGWDFNGNGTNSSRLNCLPGGSVDYDWSFKDLGKYGTWWSSSLSTDGTDTLALARSLGTDSDQVFRYAVARRRGFSIRCIKD